MRRYFHGLVALLLAALIILAAALVFRQGGNGWQLETDLQALLPQGGLQQQEEIAARKLGNQFGNRLVLGLQGEDRHAVLQAAPLLQQAVADSGLAFVNEPLTRGPDSQALSILQDHHFYLLGDVQRRWLQQRDWQALQQHAAAALMGLAAASGLSPAKDPLALFAGYQKGWQPDMPGELHENRWLLEDQDGVLLLSVLELQDDSLSLSVHEKLNAMVAELTGELAAYSGVSLLRSGVAFHAAQASGQAQREILWIGTGTCVGIILLFLAAFRRMWPLALSLGSVLFGCALAFVLNHAWYGSLHLITLVFGAGLIGVAVDYSLHFLCLRQQSPALSGRELLEQLLPALCLGLMTSLLGYACLYQANAEALQQIASFSLSGLFCAWLAVVVMFPRVARGKLPPAVAAVGGLARLPFTGWQYLRAWRYGLLLVALGVVLAGVSRVEINHDVRVLYQPAEDLARSEQILQRRLHVPSASQFFLVEAGSPDALLEQEERLRERLMPLLRQGALEDIVAISEMLPSPSRQREDRALLANMVYQPGGQAEYFMEAVGFAQNDIDALRTSFQQSGPLLTVEEGLALLPDNLRSLWLGEIDGQYYSVVVLRGGNDSDAPGAVAETLSGVSWVDRVAGLSRALAQLADKAGGLLVAAYVVVTLLLLAWFRRPVTMGLVLVPLVATLLSLSLLSLMGASFSVFHLFACYLILGLGMDYSIFVYLTGGGRACQRAVLLSVLTSGLSFGLLALSSTPMIQAFGATLLLGGLFNWLLAPLCIPAKKREGGQDA